MKLYEFAFSGVTYIVVAENYEDALDKARGDSDFFHDEKRYAPCRRYEFEIGTVLQISTVI